MTITEYKYAATTVLALIAAEIARPDGEGLYAAWRKARLY